MDHWPPNIKPDQRSLDYPLVHLTSRDAEWNSHVPSPDCVSGMTLSNWILVTPLWVRQYHFHFASKKKTETRGSRILTQGCLARQLSSCAAFWSVPTVPFPLPVWTSSLSDPPAGEVPACLTPKFPETRKFPALAFLIIQRLNSSYSQITQMLETLRHISLRNRQLIKSELGPLLPLSVVCEPRRRRPSFGECFHPSWQFVISVFVLHTGVDILWSLPLPQRQGLPRKARAHSNESQNNSPGCDQDKNHILKLRFRKVYPKINPKPK